MLPALAALALATGCTTTEQEVAEQIEVLAANEIDSERWNQAVDELVSIGRPAARQLMVLLDPGKYRGKDYREFRAEIEQTRTGATVVLGRIKHKAASAQIHPRTAAGTYTFAERVASLRAVGELGYNQPAVTALKTLYEGEADPVIRLYTALALVKMNETSGVGAVHEALSADADPALAKIAIEELRRTNYFGVPLLVELRASDSPYRERISLRPRRRGGTPAGAAGIRRSGNPHALGAGPRQRRQPGSDQRPFQAPRRFEQPRPFSTPRPRCHGWETRGEPISFSLPWAATIPSCGSTR